MKAVGIVPAKGTSNRVPSKNRQEVLGVPLFLWAANNLARVLPRDHVFVDSDAAEIRNLAKAQGFGVIERPHSLATNATDGNELMLWAASQVEADLYVHHLPPMPFLRPGTLRRALAEVEGGKASAVGVRREKVYLWNEQGPTYDVRKIPNSFTLPDTVVEGMGFYAMRRSALLDQRVRVANPSALIDLDAYEAVDVDYPEDLEFARTLAAGLPPDHELVAGLAGLRGRPRSIRMLAVDVDGVLTDGGMYVSEAGDELKKFNAKDGMAIKHLLRTGVEVAFVSSSTHASILKARARRLGVERVHAGPGNKREILEGWCGELGIDMSHVAYVGDDVNDLPALRHAGLAACPRDATHAVRSVCDVVLERSGGRGCIRELVDEVLGHRVEAA